MSNLSMMRRRSTGAGRLAGFTLIELMITVVVVAILASIAIPAYTSQIRKSRRTDAKTALLELAGREERFLATQNAYTDNAVDLGYGPAGTVFPLSVGSGYYTMSVQFTAGDATTLPTFTATADPVAGKGQDQDNDCHQFKVVSTGAQTSTNSSSANSSSTCWK
jgi:type IV pilus assembly protein PilE